MNLIEYMSQTDPKRGVQVDLKKSEYKAHSTVKVGMDFLTSVTVNAYPEYDYILINFKGRLMTTDKDGNPEKMSVFNIDKLEQI